MTLCQWPGCRDPATHIVTIEYPGKEPREVWEVCYRHQHEPKRQAADKRPTAPPTKEQLTTIEVSCGACQRPLDEPRTAEPRPCPYCGSVERLVKLGTGDVATAHDFAAVTDLERAWFAEFGDSNRTMLKGWGRLERTVDTKRDYYRELIEFFDGTRIETVARVRDHQ